ncbi:MAG: hypothetical protein KAR38_07175 [Calditrichia bacterium]|nr:hypothetical protein [Calditrichia bacterium]
MIIKSYKLLFIFLILISVLFATPEITVKSSFDRDTCEVGELAHLSLKLKWKGDAKDIDVVNIKIPTVPWLKVEDTGTSRGVCENDSAFYKFDVCLLFLAPGNYQVRDIKLYYKYLNNEIEKINITSDKIQVNNRIYEHPSDYFAGNYLFIIIVLILIVLLFAFLFRYKRIKANLFNKKTYNENAIIINNYLTKLNQLFNKKKLNYNDSLEKLKKVTLSFKEESLKLSGDFHESISKKIENLLKKMEVLNSHKFVSFNEFENIYHEVYHLIKNIHTENSNGGTKDDGYSKD